MKNQNHRPKKHNIQTRSSKNFDSDAFLHDYETVDWDNVIDIAKNDVNFSMESFISKIDGLLDIHLPLRKVSKKEFKQKFKPWISNNLLIKIGDKNKAFRKYLKANNPVQKSQNFTKFKALKNEVRNVSAVTHHAYTHPTT